MIPLVGMPIVIGCTAYVYRVFKGKVVLVRRATERSPGDRRVARA
jgi:cytochrome bd-type quinol oxidase subunit 2